MDNGPILIIGGSGMLGQALTQEAEKRELNFKTLSRKDSQLSLDITDIKTLSQFDFSPFKTIINAAANTNIDECEANPNKARQINALPLNYLSEVTRKSGCYLLNISTDHFFSGDRSKVHDENHPVKLLNEYAKSKFEGEQFTLKNPKALVVRTNIVGWRGWPDRPTFTEWVLKTLKMGNSFTAFSDFYTSSIDVGSFSKALFDLILKPDYKRPAGVLNLASSQVASKKEFIEAFALRGGFDLKAMLSGSVSKISGVRRAESLGLNVSRAENLLGYALPDLKAVVEALYVRLRAGEK